MKVLAILAMFLLWAYPTFAQVPITVALSLPEGSSIVCGPRTTKLIAATTGPVTQVSFYYGESIEAMRVVTIPPFEMDWSVDCRWTPSGLTKLKAVAWTADMQQVTGQVTLTILAQVAGPPVPVPPVPPTPVQPGPTPTTPPVPSCTEGAYACTCTNVLISPVTAVQPIWSSTCSCAEPIMAKPVPAEVETLLAKAKWFAADGYKALKVILRHIYGR